MRAFFCSLIRSLHPLKATTGANFSETVIRNKKSEKPKGTERFLNRLRRMQLDIMYAHHYF